MSSRRFLVFAATLLIVAASFLFAAAGLEVAVRILDLWREPRALILYAAEDADGQDPPATRRIPHPYLGWQSRPGSVARFLGPERRGAIFGESGPSEWALRNGRTNRLGFLSSIEEYSDLPPGDYVVGIFGGSVASVFASIGGEALTAALSERFPTLRGSISIVNVASPGYRQPQQAFALAQMLLLGVPFDLIINVDGFNEVAFGGPDAMSGYHPLFPWSAHFQSSVDFARGTASGESIEVAATILREKRASGRLQQRFRGSFLRHIEVGKALGGLLLQRHQRRIFDLEARLEAASRKSAGASEALAQSEPCVAEACWVLIADLWERASRLMATMAQDAGAEYVHVLQPNQYVEGSKTLSDRERAHYFNSKSPNARFVRSGYPYLQERGRRLQSQHIAFTDLSGVFSQRVETIYADACCHYNLAGYEILADAVAGLVRGPKPD